MASGLLAAPSASSSKEEHADWLELRSILDGDLSSSIQDLVRELRRGGAVPEVESSTADWGSESSERIAQDAFAELEGRAKACGEERYPFDIARHSITLRPDFRRSPYTFQLLLSRYGLVKHGETSPEKLFEELSAHAARRYFGTDGTALGFAFGFPRRYEAKNFVDALNHLCGQLGEGGGAILPEKGPAGIAKLKRLSEQKDGKLDIVVWRPFPDGRPGKLIGFGQCATGITDWQTKFAELQPSVFRELWLRTGLAVGPVRMFFVPRRVEEDRWHDVAVAAGLLFDRCRISHHVTELSPDLSAACEAWTTHVIKIYLPGPSGAAARAKATAKKAGARARPITKRGVVAK